MLDSLISQRRGIGIVLKYYAIGCLYSPIKGIIKNYNSIITNLIYFFGPSLPLKYIHTYNIVYIFSLALRGTSLTKDQSPRPQYFFIQFNPSDTEYIISIPLRMRFCFLQFTAYCWFQLVFGLRRSILRTIVGFLVLRLPDKNPHGYVFLPT